MSFEQHRELVEAAAKLMQEECIVDPLDAVRRAAKRLNIKPACVPRAEDVRAALNVRLALFDPHWAKRLENMRRAALQAMEFLAAFHPRVFGGIVEGNVPSGSPIQIECRTDHPDHVLKHLDALKIPTEQRQLLKPGQCKTWFEFKAGDFNFELHTLTLQERGFKTNLRADAEKLRALIGST
jgi:hypothetical protein